MAVLIKIFKHLLSVEGELIMSAEPTRLQEIAPNPQTHMALVYPGGSQNKTNRMNMTEKFVARGMVEG